MDPFDQLLDLKQGSSPIEEYVTQFYKISCKVPFDEVALKDIFRFGLCEPIESYLPEGKFHCSLKDFMHYALLCAGSSFSVGVAKEEHDTALTPVMADAPFRPGLIACVLDAPLVSVRAAGIPRSASLSAPSQELSFVSAGPAQLSFVSAGPAQLAFSMESV